MIATINALLSAALCRRHDCQHRYHSVLLTIAIISCITASSSFSLSSNYQFFPRRSLWTGYASSVSFRHYRRCQHLSILTLVSKFGPDNSRTGTSKATRGDLILMLCTMNAPASDLVEGQSVVAVQTFLNFVSVEPSSPDDGDIDPVPKATTVDIFTYGHTPLKIPRRLFMQIIDELKKGLIPPIYHVLVKGKPCVAFRKNADVMPSSVAAIARTISFKEESGPSFFSRRIW
jgi:hypothetical protein